MPHRFLGDGEALVDWKGVDRMRRFRRFCAEYIVIPDGFNAGEPMTLYPPQVEWVRSILSTPATIITVAKGNAKSSTMAAVAFWWAADPPPGDLNTEVVIVAGSKDQARAGVYDTFVSMLQGCKRLTAGWHYHAYSDTNDPRVEFRNGATVRIRSASPKRLHGIKPSLSILDEIGLVDDPAVWNTLVQSLGKRPGARAVGIGTPGWIRGALWDLKVSHDTGGLGRAVAFHEHAAHPLAAADDRRAWAAANPVRKAMDPAGWEQTLAAIRAMPTITEADWRTFHLAQWPDLRGAPVVSADRWDLLAQPDVFADPGEIHVAIDGDWQRRNAAVVAVSNVAGRLDVWPLGVWEHQRSPIDVDDLAAAIRTLPHSPATVTVGRSMMAVELVDRLANDGLAVTELNTSSAASMRDPTDRLLAAIASGGIAHDGNTLLRAQVLGARQDVRRDGVVFTRDDRLHQRIDALVALAAAAHAAATAVVPMIY